MEHLLAKRVGYPAPLLLLFLTLWSFSSFAYSGFAKDSTKVERDSQGNNVRFSETGFRHFQSFTTLSAKTRVDPIVISDQLITDSVLYHRSKAQQYQQEVMRRNALIGNLNDMYSVELPLGISNRSGDLNYTVIITEISGDTKGPVLEAYMLFELPETGDKIAFRGRNIKFSYAGALLGTGRLELIGNYPIVFSDKMLFTLLGKGNPSGAQTGSFVEFDCNGFKGLSIEGEIEFSRDLIVPEGEDGQQKSFPARVKTGFVAQAQNWSDLLVGVSLPPFQVNGLKDVGFNVHQAFLDWSDLANPSGLVFPPGYSSPFIQAGQVSLWRGFYLHRLDIKLPVSFKQKQTGMDDGNARITLGAEHMILDDQGLSGSVFAENVLASGDMNGWAYTIDRILLDVAINKVKGFELDGRISIPKIKKRDNAAAWFNYTAQRCADDSYLFAVKVDNELNLPLLAAEMTLYQGSSITVRERDNTFHPTAMLSGDLHIKGTTKGIKPGFSKIRFEGMRISTEEPRFDIRAIGLGGSDQQQVSGYPVVISTIKVKNEPSRIGLQFNLTLNIGGKAEEEGFGGTGTLTVWGKESSDPLKSREGEVIATEKDWVFDKVEMSGVGIQVKKPGVVELAGTVLFFDEDPLYGNGFTGTIKGKFGKIGVAMDVAALFGKSTTYRYWFADALVEFKKGIPIVPGLSAFGFAGGYYSHMKQSTEPVTKVYGKTRSGIAYLPDENAMGVKAMVILGTVRPEAFRGDVALEMELNRHGGINGVAFKGNALFMGGSLDGVEAQLVERVPAAISGKLDKLMELYKGQVYGNMILEYDHVNEVFHGNLEVFVNVVGGMLRGVSDGGKAGWATLHFSQNEWYIWIGTPDQPLGLEVARIFKSRSYFMLGSNVQGSPPPPSQVTEILGPVQLDYMRDMNALQSGSGYAFGLSFMADTGDLRFLMFYGRFTAGAGVDFMLKDYGNQFHCDASSGPVGINGWYANGQAYAFVLGKVGVKVNLKFYKGSYDILNIGAVAVMQIKAPNPFWMKGTVGGNYRILGGLVKGHCKFEVTVGKDCKSGVEQNLLDDVKIIAAMRPLNNSKVDVFEVPQVAFNIPVGEIFEITDAQNNLHTFRVVLNEFSVWDGTQFVQGTLQWNDENDVVIFAAQDMLPGEKKIKARARLTFEEKVKGTWTSVRIDGKVVEEMVETSFETDKAPDYLPAKNVELSYPLASQANFYPKEYNQGFIQLKVGQAYLFDPGHEWIQKVRMTETVSQQYLESDLSYNPAERKVTFTLPTGFENGKEYQFEVLNIPRQNTLMDANVQKVETELNAMDVGSATLTTKKMESNLERREVRSIFSSSFRTSKYNTFVEKMKGIQLSQTLRFNRGVLIYQLRSYLKGEEAFDADEITGSADALIKMEAILSGNSWYEKYAFPLVYEGYPLLGWMKVRRSNAEAVGIPPRGDVYIENFSRSTSFVENETHLTSLPFTTEYVTYNVGEQVAYDFYDIRAQVVGYLADHPEIHSTRLESLITQPLPRLRYGPYKVMVNYVIPGVNKMTSSYPWELFNRIPDND